MHVGTRQSPQRRLVDDPWEASTPQQGIPGCEYAATVLGAPSGWSRPYPFERSNL